MLLTPWPKFKMSPVILNDFLGPLPELYMCLALRKCYNQKILNNRPLKMCPLQVYQAES